MEIKEYLSIIKKRILFIIIITLSLTLISSVVSYFVIKPTYTANISVIINKSSSSNNANNTANYNDLLLYQNSVKTYAILATSRKVADDVIDKLSLKITPNGLIGMISATPNASTEFMTLTVKDKDPKQAMDIANQLAKSLRDISISVKNEDLVHLVDEAQMPTSPSNPKPLLNIAIAFFLGLMLSVGIVFLLEYLDNTVKTQEDIEKLLELPVIGTIPLIDNN